MALPGAAALVLIQRKSWNYEQENKDAADEVKSERN